MKLLFHLKNDRYMYRIICIMICLTSYSLVRGKNGIGVSIPLYCATNNSLSIIIDSITNDEKCISGIYVLSFQKQDNDIYLILSHTDSHNDIIDQYLGLDFFWGIGVEIKGCILMNGTFFYLLNRNVNNDVIDLFIKPINAQLHLKKESPQLNDDTLFIFKESIAFKYESGKFKRYKR